MVDVASTNNNDVITEVVGGVEVAKVVSRNLLDVVAVSLNGLAHHVLSVYIEMAVLNGSFQVAVVVVFVLLSNLLLNELEFVGVKSAVSDNISKKLDGLANITFEDLERNLSVLSVSSACETTPHVFNGLCNVALGAVGGSTEEHLFKEVRGT